MRIAVDAMGGDRAPEMVVEGGIEAVKSAGGDFDLVLVGRKDEIERVLSRKEYASDHVDIIDAPEVIGMSESPATAIRKKKDSSIQVAITEHREGRVDAVFSAGNTGAAVAASLLSLGRLPGISRPAIAITIPTRSGGTVLLDGGANSDCYPHHLQQFAYMGSIYSEDFLDKAKPRVGLLNIGEERSKGNELARETFTLLEDSGLNFVGNVEGKDIFDGEVDVVVTDGFVGNVVLKFTEGIVSYMGSLLREEIGKALLPRVGALFMKPAMNRLKKKLDYAEYGAMPLLGINGATFIGHGGSSPRAVKNGLLAIVKFVGSGVNDKIINRMREGRG